MVRKTVHDEHTRWKGGAMTKRTPPLQTCKDYAEMQKQYKIIYIK